MIIKIQAQGFGLTPSLREFTESKVRLALSRFSHRINYVDAMLLDINGPKGGEDKRCRFKLKIDKLQVIVVQETHEDMYEAINVCSARLKRTASRKLGKFAGHSRMSLRDGFEEPGLTA